jgi:subtilisin family serine protease
MGWNPRVITLHWSDALEASANDYDLYVADIQGNMVNFSIDSQTGTQNPYERTDVGDADPSLNYTGYFILIHKRSGADRTLRLSAYRGTTQYATTGATYGPRAAKNTFCVSAVSAQSKTTLFTGAEPLEPFTSDGPLRVFYLPDGTPITPGYFSSTGGSVLMKPDITAVDKVACSAPGFNPFGGTSAAAPHAAAIAGLLLSAKPTATAAEIRRAITLSALPAPPVWNNVAGYGIVMIHRALGMLLGGRGVV